MAMTRRQWIKTGVAGGALLATAAWTTKGTFWGNGSRRAKTGAYEYTFLTHADRQVMQAIIPVILLDVFSETEGHPKDLLEETIQRFDLAVSGLYPAVQGEIRQLFSLLTLGPGRMIVAGVWSSWEKASPEAIASFLTRWKTSRFSLLQTGYDALQQLSVAAWYGNPKAWAAIDYAGPPSFTS